MIGSLGPIFTMLLAAAVLGEPLGWMQIAGAALVVVAVNRLVRGET